MILSVNRDYFLKHHQSLDLCNGEVLCFLCGTEWIIKYYLDQLWLQGVEDYKSCFHHHDPEMKKFYAYLPHTNKLKSVT
jgi:hypothetical protein